MPAGILGPNGTEGTFPVSLCLVSQLAPGLWEGEQIGPDGANRAHSRSVLLLVP